MKCPSLAVPALRCWGHSTPHVAVLAKSKMVDGARKGSIPTFFRLKVVKTPREGGMAAEIHPIKKLKRKYAPPPPLNLAKT